MSVEINPGHLLARPISSNKYGGWILDHAGSILQAENMFFCPLKLCSVHLRIILDYLRGKMVFFCKEQLIENIIRYPQGYFFIRSEMTPRVRAGRSSL